MNTLCNSTGKEDAHIKRGIKNTLESFCYTTRHIFEPMCVYEPGFSTDKCGTYIATSITITMLYNWLYMHLSYT